MSAAGWHRFTRIVPAYCRALKRRVTPVGENNWKLMPGPCPVPFLFVCFADINLYPFAAINYNQEYNSSSEFPKSFWIIIKPEGGLGGHFTQTGVSSPLHLISSSKGRGRVQLGAPLNW